MNRIIFIIALVIAILFSANTQAETLVFGVVPQQSAKKLAETWVPVLNKLSEETGKKIVFATAKDIPTFEKRLAEKKYDIAYMNPYHYVVYAEQAGYRALAKQRDKRIQGIIVVHKDNPVQSLQDLHTKTIAFPSPAAFAASIIPQAVMHERGIEITPRYVSSHDSVYLNVVRQFMFAGGGVMRTLKAAPRDVTENLRVLWRSEKYTPHAIATAQAVPDETRKLVLDALLALNDSPENKPLLDAIAFSGFESAKNEDWDDVRGLDINVVLPKILTKAQ